MSYRDLFRIDDLSDLEALLHLQFLAYKCLGAIEAKLVIFVHQLFQLPVNMERVIDSVSTSQLVMQYAVAVSNHADYLVPFCRLSFLLFCNDLYWLSCCCLQ